jgi:hypothetical protein
VKPAVLSPGEVAFHGRDGSAATEMNIRRLPTHVISEPFLVAFAWERLKFYVATIGSKAANDPVSGKMNMWIENAHGAVHNLPA